MILLFLTPFTIYFNIIYVICGASDMLDGIIARKTGHASAFGEKLDSIADLIFTAVCLYKIIPLLSFPVWLWIWTALIASVKIVNIISGYVCRHKLVMLHTTANKVTGFMLFLLPLTLTFADLKYAAIPVCLIASFAAIQEGHFIRTGAEPPDN